MPLKPKFSKVDQAEALRNFSAILRSQIKFHTAAIVQIGDAKQVTGRLGVDHDGDPFLNRSKKLM